MHKHASRLYLATVYVSIATRPRRFICAAMALCCLCRVCAPPDHRRKKKFHGASCNTAKQTLSALSEYPLDSLVETSDPSAILCHACERKLTTIHNLEAKDVSMKEDVKRLLSSLQKAGAVNLGKRSRGYGEAEVLTPKRALKVEPVNRLYSTRLQKLRPPTVPNR